jgi:uncharacterized protein (TIGR02145 family)
MDMTDSEAGSHLVKRAGILPGNTFILLINNSLQMKTIVLALLMFFPFKVLTAQDKDKAANEVQSGVFTDKRDNQTYRWVKIGRQVWMARNLNFDSGSGSWCYDDLKEKGRKYGRLYTWETALRVAPEGWHLPSDSEWEELKILLRKNLPVGTSLKSAQGWDFNGNGTDLFGFNALPSGYRNSDEAFNLGGNSCFWWSATGKDDSYAWARHLKFNYTFLNRFRGNKKFGFAIRCIRNE